MEGFYNVLNEFINIDFFQFAFQILQHAAAYVTGLHQRTVAKLQQN
jgi:hypothetical protein